MLSISVLEYVIVFSHRSCAYRDVVGQTLSCDLTWLSTNPINPLCVGQFVNNHTGGMTELLALKKIYCLFPPGIMPRPDPLMRVW